MALRALQLLRERAPDWESHLILTPAGWLNVQAELPIGREEFEAWADVVHPWRNVGACIASGSYRVDAMAVLPCSMRSLGAIAHGLSDNLLTRAADVMLKERRRLVIVPREAPLNLAHLRNMTAITEMGGIIFPPVPAFYHRPATIDELVDHMVLRILETCGVELPDQPRWMGLEHSNPA